MNITILAVLALIACLVALLYLWATASGETKYSGKMADGANIAVKKQGVPRYKKWTGETIGKWLPDNYIPGVGNIPGHSVKDVWATWTVGVIIGALVVFMIAMVIMLWN